nr:hypothetical protein [Tanacetum cinerariifolium]
MLVMISGYERCTSKTICIKRSFTSLWQKPNLQRLLYDNSSSRPPKEIVSDNSHADIESFSPSPIPNLDSDPLMEEIDLSFNPDDPMPPVIEDDDYDSGRDILILVELLDNYSLSLPTNESDYFDIPSPYRPPAKPPDGNTGTLNIKMMGDVSDPKVKEYQENDKIISKPDKNGKRGEAGKSQKQLQSVEEEKLNKMLKEGPNLQNEFIKSCVENLIPNPSESEGKNGCDVLTAFTTFSNVLFDADYDSDSSDDQSLSDEDVPEKIYSNPLFDEEIIPMEIDLHSFTAESDLIESIPNHDSSVIISSKIYSFFDEFAEIVSDNSHADIESFFPSPIPNLDSDPMMEEIDLSFNLDDPMPPGIKDDDYESGRDIPILVELLDNYSLSLPTNESDYFDIPSPYRPPAKPPDGNT